MDDLAAGQQQRVIGTKRADRDDDRDEGARMTRRAGERPPGWFRVVVAAGVAATVGLGVALAGV